VREQTRRGRLRDRVDDQHLEMVVSSGLEPGEQTGCREMRAHCANTVRDIEAVPREGALGGKSKGREEV
jgi:hypothetical protein